MTNCSKSGQNIPNNMISLKRLIPRVVIRRGLMLLDEIRDIPNLIPTRYKTAFKHNDFTNNKLISSTNQLNGTSIKRGIFRWTSRIPMIVLLKM